MLGAPGVVQNAHPRPRSHTPGPASHPPRYGIELEFAEDALVEVATRAVDEKTGARGLLTVLEAALRPFKFELPSTSVTRLVVDARTVRDPERALRALLHTEGERPGDTTASRN